MKKITNLIIILISVAIFSACTPSVGNPMADTANTLIQTKANMITLFQGISTGCQAGLIPASECTNAAVLYPKVQLAYQTAVDALVLAVSTGDQTQVQTNMTALNAMLADVVAIKGATK